MIIRGTQVSFPAAARPDSHASRLPAKPDAKPAEESGNPTDEEVGIDVERETEPSTITLASDYLILIDEGAIWASRWKTLM